MEMILEKKNVPKLRFKEFDDDWILKKIDKIAPLQRGFDLPLKKIQKGNYPVVYSNGILRTHNEYKVKGEGVVTGRSGTIGKVTFVKENHWPHNTTLWVTNYFNNNKKFIYYFYLQLKLQRFNAGSTVPTLNRNDVHFLNKRIPNQIKEQQKIASFLTVVDEKLQQLTKKKELLEDYKKGIMQKIFSQKIRFKDNNGKEYPDWEERRLGELCVFSKSGGTPKSTNKEYYNGNIPFLSISDMTKQGKYLNYTTKSISKEGLINSSSWIVPTDTIIYSMYASVGFVAINKIPIATSQAVINLGLNSYCDTEFIYYNLSDIKKHIHRFIETGTQGNLNAQTVKKLKIKLPTLEEQKKIANFLATIDKRIESVSNQLEKTKEFKKGLLQQMFV